MRTNVERCGYCGQFMRYENGIDWGEQWVCSRQSEHILSDPEHWSVDTVKLGPDAVDADGDPLTGFVGAHWLTEAQLRIVLDLPTHPTEPEPAESKHDA